MKHRQAIVRYRKYTINGGAEQEIGSWGDYIETVGRAIQVLGLSSRFLVLSTEIAGHQSNGPVSAKLELLGQEELVERLSSSMCAVFNCAGAELRHPWINSDGTSRVVYQTHEEAETYRKEWDRVNQKVDVNNLRLQA